MKKLLLPALLILFSLSSLAQSESEMKAWQAYMTPGEMHKHLAASAGNWKGEITIWTAPGTQPMKSTGTAKNEMIMGGRYLQSSNTGNFMGMPFEGTGITAYDNAKKVFVNTWIDNMGTGIMISEGKWNPAKNAIEFSGKQTDPMTGKEMKFRETFTINADGSQLLEMWMEVGGKEFKSMEVKYTKA
ncbi:MAG: DUF1579 domain-containing protein [Flavisolibacter sp.]|nr:DUF1579 domain-containing protein [Flavisolibacter sp.]